MIRGPRIRILHVLEATAGGTRRHLRELVSSLPRASFHSSIACAVQRDPAFEDDIREYRARGVDVHVVPMTRAPNLYRDVAACMHLRGIVRSTGCDVLHLHSAKAGLIGRVASVGMRCPVIYAPHAFSFLEPSIWGRLAWVAERALASRTTLLWAVSRAEAALAVARAGYAPGAVRVVPNTVQADATACDTGGLVGGASAEGALRFGFLGALRAQKQPLLFLRGILELSRQPHAERIKPHFVMPNVGPLFEAAREFVERHQLGDRVTFVDTTRSLEPLYRQIDVGVLPSAYEGLPYALLDALARGMPVIGSNIPVFAETIGRVDQRLLSPAQEPSALAATMGLWASLPRSELLRAGSLGRALVAAEYHSRDWVGAIAAMYEEVVRRERAGRASDRSAGAAEKEPGGAARPAARPLGWVRDSLSD
jgi:glycosyltransferase involved in cell wall biosynthesis